MKGAIPECYEVLVTVFKMICLIWSSVEKV